MFFGKKFFHVSITGSNENAARSYSTVQHVPAHFRIG